MHIIWKRPDGFQNSLPDDFERVQLSNGAQLWLHKTEKDWFPFQVSGDWAGQTETQQLNKLINSIGLSDEAWNQIVADLNDGTESQAEYASKLVQWIDGLMPAAKGQTWELEIVHCALKDVKDKLVQLCH